MKDEINKIIQSISDFYKLDNALKYYLDRNKAQRLLDYITNLQEELEEEKRIEQASLDTINNLQEENERLKEERQNINNRNYNQKIANRKLMEDIEKLRTNLKTNKRRRKKQTHKKNIYKSRCEKANWWLKEMLKQAKSDETKAIINGTLELLNGDDE